jgi:hypothetical protein
MAIVIDNGIDNGIMITDLNLFVNNNSGEYTLVRGCYRSNQVAVIQVFIWQSPVFFPKQVGKSAVSQPIDRGNFYLLI